MKGSTRLYKNYLVEIPDVIGTYLLEGKNKRDIKKKVRGILHNMGIREHLSETVNRTKITEIEVSDISSRIKLK